MPTSFDPLERPTATRADAPDRWPWSRLADLDRRLRASRRATKAVLALAAVVLFVFCTAFLYALSIHADLPNSDGATIVLEGQAMAHGHLTLHDWSLSLDSYWGVDAFVYMFAVLIGGVQASYLHLVPALIAAAVVVCGALMAIEARRRLAAFAGALVVVGILAFPSQAMALNLLVGPTHVGTALWCLIAFFGLRSGRFGWGWGVAVVFLTAGLLGDLQTLLLGTFPVIFAGLACSARGRRLRAGLPLASAGVASVLFALAVRKVVDLIGAFALIKPQPLPTATRVLHNVSLLGNYLPKVFGVGSTGFGTGGQPFFTEFARGIGFVLVIAAVLVALFELLSGVVRGETAGAAAPRSFRLDDQLCFAFIGGLVMFVAITPQALTSYARYLLPSAIFGTVLAGRLVARVGAELADRAPSLPRAIPLASIALFAAIFGIHATGAGFELAKPAPADSYADVAQFLQQQHLSYGVGDYWSASIVTVMSDEKIKVRAVTQGPKGTLVRYSRESSAAWYKHRVFRFVVYDPSVPFGNVNRATAVATFGKVARSYRIDQLEVLVMAHPFSVSPVGVT